MSEAVHAYDPSLDYETVLKKMQDLSRNSTGARFEIAKLVKVALSMGIAFKQIAMDTGYSEPTLSKYLEAWSFWGENRIPGERVVWTTYTQHMDWRDKKWVEENNYRQQLLEGGRPAADNLAKKYVEDHRRKAPLNMDPMVQQAWLAQRALHACWQARLALDSVDFSLLGENERKRMAEHFSSFLKSAENFRKAVTRKEEIHDHR